MISAAELAALLNGKKVGNHYEALCPAHNDTVPSLEITEKDGKTLFICRAGCPQDRIVFTLRQLGVFRERDEREDVGSNFVCAYDYRDASGQVVFQKVRWRAPPPKGKTFSLRHPDGAGGWIKGVDGVDWHILYRLPELLAEKGKANGKPHRIYLCEGEKDVDRLRERWDVTATTNPEGAREGKSQWRAEYNEYFRGADVVILPDNDAAGFARADFIAPQLALVAACVRVVELPDLGPKADISDWLDEGGTQGDLEDLIDGTKPFRAPPKPETLKTKLSLANWLSRELPKPDFLLGELLSTTSRVEIIGPTGIGKTNIGLAAALAVSDGRDFLHWRGSGKPRRVLYIDGEMSRGLLQQRLKDAVRRFGGVVPDTFFILSREDFEENGTFQPLNSEAGQKFINDTIEELGGVDLFWFDNIQALLSGNMTEEEPWQETLPWVRDLTRRHIGQAWFHHTGHDETHGYGTKTREWQLDTVILLELVERPDIDISFKLKFTKARARTPDNRSDFDPSIIMLDNDTWTSDRGGDLHPRRRGKDRALELLREAINREGTIPPASTHIPPDTSCVTVGTWRRYCDLGSITTGGAKAADKAFERASKKLLDAGTIAKWDLWVWIVPT
jgi:hypothetical protein